MSIPITILNLLPTRNPPGLIRITRSAPLGGGLGGAYLLTKFPAYILKKAHILKGGEQEALKMIDAFKAPSLPSPASAGPEEFS